MGPLTNSAENLFHKEYNSITLNQKPRLIHEKIWTREYQIDTNTKLAWNDSVLSITMESGGSYNHSFDVYILSNTSDKKTFTVVLEDTDKKDPVEVIRKVTVNVDLTDYVTPGSAFKILQLGWGSTANQIGETNFNQ